MPVKRRSAKARTTPAEVSDIAWRLLTDEPLPEEPTEEERWDEFLYAHFHRGHLNLSPPYLENLWHQHRDAILEGWVAAHPGTRPKAWWAWSAPDGRPGTALAYAPEPPPPEEQFEYLREHGLLLPGEASALVGELGVACP